MSAPPRVPPVPAVLRLVQMVVLGRWRATGEELYREVADLMEAQPGKDILVSGAGEGETSEWLAAKTGASVTGVDPNEERIERAEARARELKTPLMLSYQHASLDDLPHESNVFDGAVGEPLLSSAADPERAVAELTRVTKPMGPVVLLQLTWSSDMSESAREMLVERLGLRPHLLIEWKQMMREAGLVAVGHAHARHRPIGDERHGFDEREVMQLEPAHQRITTAEDRSERRGHDGLPRKRAFDHATIVRDVLGGR